MSGSKIQSVDRAARILRVLADHPGRLSLSELTERMELPKATVYGLARTLADHGLIEQSDDRERYQLGPTLVRLANRYLDGNEVRARSVAWAQWLAEESGEAVRVGVEHEGQVLVVHHVFRPGSTLQVLEVGLLLPMHATAWGKALLAIGPEEWRGALPVELPRLTRNTLVTADELDAELANVRRDLFAVEREESVIGESGIAAPVINGSGKVVGVLGVVTSTDRMLSDDIGRITSAVLATARGASRELGALRWPTIGP